MILVMTVALAIGISVIQRSLSDISTSSKVEQSSRAYSAAEAGIEKAISLSSNIGKIDLGNNSSIEGVLKTDIPEPGKAIEYPPLSREEVAHVWLADPKSAADPPDEFYIPANGTLDVFWGNSATDKAALELTLTYYQTGEYKMRKWYLDYQDYNRNNNFDYDSTICFSDGRVLSSALSGEVKYQCFKRLGNGQGQNNGPLPSGLMLLRARLLYNTTAQPFAVAPEIGAALPPQASIYISTGISGQTQRQVKVFKLDKVVPPFFDYAIFSADEINKQ